MMRFRCSLIEVDDSASSLVVVNRPILRVLVFIRGDDHDIRKLRL